MARRQETLGGELVKAPWWISIILAVVFYVALRFMLPLLLGNIQPEPGTNSFSTNIFRGLAQKGNFLANAAAFFFLAAATYSFVTSLFNRKERIGLFNKQKNLETIRALRWQDFEKLVGEAYRRQGYTITETGGGGADGGIDLILKKNGETIFVQCKHWKMRQVGVKIVRELLGVVVDSKASGGIVITSGTFSQDALDTSKGNPIELVDGKKLYAMIGDIKLSGVPSRQERPKAMGTPVQENPAPVLCPVCGMEMVLRTAKKGPSAGTKFYGCSRYPKCKGVRSC